MGFGLEDLDPEDENLADAMLLESLGHRITYREYADEMPWELVKARLDYRAGQRARSNADSRGAMGQIVSIEDASG